MNFKMCGIVRRTLSRDLFVALQKASGILTHNARAQSAVCYSIRERALQSPIDPIRVRIVGRQAAHFLPVTGTSGHMSCRSTVKKVNW